MTTTIDISHDGKSENLIIYQFVLFDNASKANIHSLV